MGYKIIEHIERLKFECDKLGLRMCRPKYVCKEYESMVAVIPKDNDSLPVYARDTELFVGSLADLEMWLRGVNWARGYDTLLFTKKHDENRKRKEQNVRNENLARILKS